MVCTCQAARFMCQQHEADVGLKPNTVHRAISIIIAMIESSQSTQEFPFSDFVESCGAVLFNRSDPANKTICTCQIAKSKEWVLFKGRSNIGESRGAAALREMYEETGYKGNLMPVTMETRACAPDAATNIHDEVRSHKRITEPIMCNIRQAPNLNGIKIIWWFIATLDTIASEGPREDLFDRVEFMSCEAAITRLSFDADRNVLRRAIQIVEDTLARDT